MSGVLAFWADCGPGVGLGHLMRSSAIASEAKGLGGSAAMILPHVSGSAVARGRGFEPRLSRGLSFLPSEVPGLTAVVVDSYRVQGAVLGAFRASGLPVAALDDWASNVPPADLVINGAPGADQLPYPRRAGTEYLLGARYFPLRSEFRATPQRSFEADVARVLVSVGGEDVHGLVGVLMSSVRAVFPGATVVGVCGTHTGPPPAGDVRIAPPDYPELVRSADVMVCGGGQSLVEALASGTPTVAVLLGKDQKPQISAVTAAGAAIGGGSWESETADLDRNLRAALASLREAGIRSELSKKGRMLVDGQGARRVARAVLALAARA